ncbi:MAG: restriction endonuclease, partial [Clostridiales bacterium]|nr:restriction endonuclease [Clostridiales bacterium]
MAVVKIDVLALRGFIAKYKASFGHTRLGDYNEIYKWKAVKCFQDNWDIEAPDFHAMLRAALAQTRNLLANANNFPKGMLEDFAKIRPEEVREMFRNLFDESIGVQTRAKRFAERAAELRTLNPVWKQDYQTPNAISTYLWLRYPDKYYIYKYSVIKDNAQKLCGMDMPTGKLDRMVFGFDLYDAICAELAKDAELVKMSQDSLS